IAQAIVKITNPSILPSRRVSPPIGKVDTASVVAVSSVEIIRRAILFASTGYGTPSVEVWLTTVAVESSQASSNTYFYAILSYALLSSVAPGGYSPSQSLSASSCEPISRPFRRSIPAIAGIDSSPSWAMIAIQVISRSLP
ncbi:hypothetical protein OY671_010729, partial [Metschnikowia pulcherrima]